MGVPTENSRAAALLFAGVIAVAVFAWWMSLAPNPLPADAPAAEFSAYRAIEHVKHMAVEPHPGGSHENEKVYDYIVAQLKAMGVEYTVERPIFVRARGNTAGRDGAILARIKGTASTGALGIDAHFDSTPYGPGATDDLSGTAAMLETIRALKAGAPLKNDIIFCFADKEEMGGHGPQVFIDHPWYQDVRAVLGLETRGTDGPALMFETGRDNGFLIRQLAQSDARPRATSIMFDFYARMPFGTDFTQYKRGGMPGLNVAYIDGFCNYHTMLDNPENASLASLQHHGYYALGVSRQLGNVSLENCRAPDATYFNTIGSHMIIYPMSWGWPLTLAIFTLFLATLAFGFIRRKLSPGGMLKSASIQIAAAVLNFALSAPLVLFVYNRFHEHALYRNGTFALAFGVIALGIFMLMARLARGRVCAPNLMAGAMLLWAVPLIPAQAYLSGGVFAILWPLAFCCVSLLILIFAEDHDNPSPARLIAAAVPLLVPVILLAPQFPVFSYTLTALSMPVCNILILALVALFLPQTMLIPRRRHTQAGILLLAVGFGLFATAVFTNTPSPQRRHMNCLSYAVNFDTNEAWWLSFDDKLDEWTRNFFKDDGPRAAMPEFFRRDDGFEYRRAAAPPPPFGKTVLEKREDQIVDGKRRLKFFVDSPRDAQEVTLRIDSDVIVHGAKVFGHEMNSPQKNWYVRLVTMPFEGGEIELEVEPGKPLDITARETSFKLPEIPGFPPRPDWMMTQTNRRLNRSHALASNHTYSICSFHF